MRLRRIANQLLKPSAEALLGSRRIAAMASRGVLSGVDGDEQGREESESFVAEMERRINESVTRRRDGKRF